MARDRGRSWYRWCPADFYADPAVLRMSREERGRYREALDASWMSATPGDHDANEWRKMLGYSVEEWDRSWEVFEPAFRADGRRWVQQRLLSEWLHATEKSRKASASAQRSLSVRSTDAAQSTREYLESTGEKEEPTPLSEVGRVIPKTGGNPIEEEWVEAFPQFWDEYPRHEKKVDAAKAWMKVPLRGQEGFDQVMRGLYRWQKAAQWTRDSGKYVPLAGGWLRGQQWDDEIAEESC
jgi:uncharacterized protein YdaU (DUF1376 family)